MTAEATFISKPFTDYLKLKNGPGSMIHFRNWVVIHRTVSELFVHILSYV